MNVLQMTLKTEHFRAVQDELLFLCHYAEFTLHGFQSHHITAVFRLYDYLG